MFGFRLPYIPGVPLWAYILTLMVAMAVPIAYYAKRKGYNFWPFLAAATLFGPLACLIILVPLPKIVGYVNKDGIEVAQSSKNIDPS